jgi:hypothetical protein
VGGFSSYAFQINLRLDRPLLGSGELDRLQAALYKGAPKWSGRVHLAAIGRWPVRTPIDMSKPGDMDAVLRRHLPGGSDTRPTRAPDEWAFGDGQARIGGADRGASLTIGFVASLHGPRPERPCDFVFIETTKPEIDGLAPATWVESLFSALCEELSPALATASSQGERMAQHRHNGTVGQHLAWLTYLSDAESTGIDIAGLERIPEVGVGRLGNGILLRLGPPPAARTYSRYLRIVDAADAVIGRERVANLLARRSSIEAGYPALPRLEPTPTPIRELIVKPTITVDESGMERIRGRRYEGVRVADIDYRKPGAVLEGFEAVKCEFDHVLLGAVDEREAPIVVRDCRLERCRISQVSFWFVQIEDCVVDTIRGSMEMLTDGLLLRHVVVRGSVDSLYLRHPGRIRPDLRAIERHRAFYEQVDWALDISAARLQRCEISGVPGRLVRRDPSTQILVTRERVLAAPWQEVAAHTPEFFAIQTFLKSPMDSEVLVACPRDDTFDKALATFARLREAGIAEPD